MPIFNGLGVIFFSPQELSPGSGQLYSEICRKRWNYRDFAYLGERRSGLYVNMVKVGFQHGELRCQQMHPAR
jgi:hypothetical protein